MSYRRHLMKGGGVVGGRGYVADGLVLLLDGIDKGGTDGVWTDLAGGLVFEPVGEVVMGDDFVKGVLKADVALATLWSRYTVETVVYNNVAQPQNINNLWFEGGVNNGIATGCYTGNSLLFRENYSNGELSAYRDKELGSKGWHMVSANLGLMLHNQTANYARTNVEVWGSRYGTACVGTANRDFNMCCIRVYDRLLTEGEMRWNQRVDVERFNIVL